MKILLINVVYGKGSTGKIVKSLFSEMSKNNETFLIYGRGSRTKDKNVFKETIEVESKIHHFFSKLSGNIYGGMPISTHRIIRRIKKINPDVVNLHCINGYFVNIYKLLSWLAKHNFKTVLTMHADFMMTGGCGYSLDCNKYLCEECRHCSFKKEFNGKISLNRTHHFFKKINKTICLFKTENLSITCVSPWLQKRYSESPIYKNFKVYSILNPVDGLFFEKATNNPYKTSNNILYVTPDITDYVKCGWLIKNLATKREDLNFTIICTRDINFKFENKNISYIKGGVSQEELRDYYYFADGTLLLSKRETFSMIVGESLACGTVVYGFKSGGPETIADVRYSAFIDFGKIDELSHLLLCLKTNKDKIRQNAFENYNIKTICNQYVAIYKL